VQKIVGAGVKVAAVVKSNAYGHGLLGIAKYLAPLADYLAVDNFEEALILREEGLDLPILILGPVEKERFKAALNYNVEFVLFDAADIEPLARLASEINKKAILHLKVDTGLSRLGFLPEEVLDIVRHINEFSYLKLEGIYSHFIDSAANLVLTSKQLRAFQNLLALLQRENLRPPLVHLANSGGVLNCPASYFDMVRVGGLLYGLEPGSGLLPRMAEMGFQPVLSWKSQVAALKNVRAGSLVGYGGSFKAKKPSLIAVIPVGYADGFDRGFSNHGFALVGNVKCPVVGRVCMRMSMLDVSAAPEVKKGDEVVLLGEQGGEKITATDLAGFIGTNSYEITTRLIEGLPRVYK
ncbi:alanine racemase, partial [Candidatus Berkelbacteria bacterium]|nr:alanine racemase [Candidatus Berkelbacteria bacterium]